MADDDIWAEVEDLEARWRALSVDERIRAEALLEDAVTLLKSECPRWKSSSAGDRRRVVCQMVRRAMTTPGDADAFGVSSASMTAGPYTQQYSYSNPNGELYSTKAERRSINGRSGRAFEIDLLGGSDD